MTCLTTSVRTGFHCVTNDPKSPVTPAAKNNKGLLLAHTTHPLPGDRDSAPRGDSGPRLTWLGIVPERMGVAKCLTWSLSCTTHWLDKSRSPTHTAGARKYHPTVYPGRGNWEHDLTHDPPHPLQSLWQPCLDAMPPVPLTGLGLYI